MSDGVEEPHSRRRLRWRGRLVWAVVWGVALLLPLYLESFWLQSGLFTMAAIVGAIGLTVLVGTTGQLSLGHAFFVAVGAYGYVYLSADAGGDLSGLSLPPFLAMVLAIALAGLAGALFSPIAGRLRGIYLGIASISLVFIGQHIMFNVEPVTGGFNGRDAATFGILGFTFGEDQPALTVLSVPFGSLERLWYLGLVMVAIAYVFALNLLRDRPGRALEMVRDNEVAASVMGVDVRRYKAAAFTVSSMYAGASGVLLALVFGRVVPESFGFLLSVDFLVMIVLGGLGSIAGAVMGAVFVIMLPAVLDRYSDSLPLLAQAGEGGVGPTEAARFIYGAAIIAVLLYLPGGLVSIWRRRPPSPAAAPITSPPTAATVGAQAPSSPSIKESST